jgi:hypothetical protein
VSPRAGLDDMENRKLLTLTELELQPIAGRYGDYSTAVLIEVVMTSLISEDTSLHNHLYENLTSYINI